MYEKLYAQIADALVEDGYIVIENALDEYIAKTLSELVIKEEGFKKAGISSASDLHVNPLIRRDSIRWLNEDNAVQTIFLAILEALRGYLNRSLYLGLKYNESHFAIYYEGDFYEKHFDTFKNSKNRVVTIVYYLNENWDQNNGGELIIYDKDDKVLKTVIPNANTLVVFMSEDFAHEVLPTKVKRYSIAGWYRVD